MVSPMSLELFLDCFTSDFADLSEAMRTTKRQIVGDRKRKAAELKKRQLAKDLADNQTARSAERSKRAKQIARLVEIMPSLLDSGLDLTGFLGAVEVCKMRKSPLEGIRKLAAKMAECQNGIEKRRLSE